MQEMEVIEIIRMLLEIKNGGSSLKEIKKCTRVQKEEIINIVFGKNYFTKLFGYQRNRIMNQRLKKKRRLPKKTFNTIEPRIES